MSVDSVKDFSNLLTSYSKDLTKDLTKLHDSLNAMAPVRLLEMLADVEKKLEKAPNSSDLALLRLELKDAFLRKCENEPRPIGLAVPQSLEKELKRASGKNPFIKRFSEATNAKEASATRRILHACVEYHKVGFTGVNAVATALPLKQREQGVDARQLTPFYDIMYARDNVYQGATFVGFIEHEYNGKTVKSSVYKAWTQKPDKNGVPQYLVKPDPSLANIFSIEENTNVYNNTLKSKEWDRLLYFTSAIAAVGACYQKA